jgi:hypothetical protein
MFIGQRLSHYDVELATQFTSEEKSKIYSRSQTGDIPSRRFGHAFVKLPGGSNTAIVLGKK